MRQTLISVAPLLLAVSMIHVGNGMLGTALPLRMDMAGFATLVAGAVMSSYFVGLVAGTFLARWLITGVGHIRAFAAFCSTLSAATLIHPFILAPVPWSGLRLVEGLCIAGLSMCAESWLNERSGDQARGRVLSCYMVTIYAAAGTGQLALNLGDPVGVGLFVAASVLMSLAIVPVSATRVAAPSLPAAGPLDVSRVYRASPIAVFGAVSSGVILGAVYGMGPLFAQRIGLGVAGTTQFMAAMILGGLVLQFPVGRLSDRFDRRRVLAVICGAMSVASLVIAVASGLERIPFLVVTALFGGLVFTVYPLCVAHANDRAQPEEMLAISTVLLLGYGVGAIAGPIVAAGAMSLLGAGGLFAVTGTVGLATGGFALWRMGRRAAPAASEQEPFRPLPRTTPVASELDPRTGEGSPEDADVL